MRGFDAGVWCSRIADHPMHQSKGGDMRMVSYLSNDTNHEYHSASIFEHPQKPVLEPRNIGIRNAPRHRAHYPPVCFSTDILYLKLHGAQNLSPPSTTTILPDVNAYAAIREGRDACFDCDGTVVV